MPGAAKNLKGAKAVAEIASGEALGSGRMFVRLVKSKSRRPQRLARRIMCFALIPKMGAVNCRVGARPSRSRFALIPKTGRQTRWP